MHKRNRKKMFIWASIMAILVAVVVGAVFLYILPAINKQSVNVVESSSQVIAHAKELVDSGKTTEAVEYLKASASKTDSAQDAAKYLRIAAGVEADRGDIEAAADLALQAGVKEPYDEEYIANSPYTAYATIKDAKARIAAEYLDEPVETARLYNTVEDTWMVGSLYDGLKDYARAIEYYKKTIEIGSSIIGTEQTALLNEKIVLLGKNL